MLAVCMKHWSFLHDFRWIHWQKNLVMKRIICTCNLCIVCSWPASYQSITKSRVTDRNLKLTIIHSSDSDSLNSMKLAGKLWTVNNEQRSVTSEYFVNSALPASLPLNFDLTNYWTTKFRATGQLKPLLHTFADLVNRVGAWHKADWLVSTMISFPTEELGGEAEKTWNVWSSWQSSSWNILEDPGTMTPLNIQVRPLLRRQNRKYSTKRLVVLKYTSNNRTQWAA